MDKSGNYCAQLKGELIRIYTQFNEAMQSGQLERAAQVADEMHEIGFKLYQLACENIKVLNRQMNEQTDPERLRILGEFKLRLTASAEKQARALDDYVIASQRRLKQNFI